MIDVIIPTCKTPAETAAMVQSMLDADDSIKKIIVTCEPTFSAAQNRNLGLKTATTDTVIMVDDDVCEFPPRWAKCLSDSLLLLDGGGRGTEWGTRVVMVSARLLNEDGTLGPMLRNPPPITSTGYTAAESLPTACIAFHNNGMRFDENFVGSGWEDDDFCAQLRQKYPRGTFLISEDVRVVHKNTMTNQGFIKGKGPVPGGNFEKNRAYYESKWGKRQ